MPFFEKKCTKMGVFLCENRKNSSAAGDVAPRPPVVAPFWQILGAPLTLHIIWAYYSCADGTEMKDTN